MNQQPLEQKKKNLEIGQENRLKGNEFFKQKDYKKALKYYHYALLYTTGLKSNEFLANSSLSGVPKTNNNDNKDEFEESIDNSLISIYNNMALCQMKLEKYERAVQTCTKALDIQDNNEKALFRRGKSYLALEKFDLAENDLKKAATISDDSGVKEALNQLKKKRVIYEKEKNEALKKMSKKMFSS